jgi:hypothetical protein
MLLEQFVLTAAAALRGEVFELLLCLRGEVYFHAFKIGETGLLGNVV